MHAVTTVLGLLTVVTLLAVAARRMTIPYPTLMVVCGLGIGLVPGLPHVELAPEIVFLVFLPPLLYAAAWYTSWNDFRFNLRPISQLAVGLVLVTTGIVAVVAHWAVPDLPWSAAFVLGALVSPPDAVAAAAVTKSLGVPKRIVTILEGESLVNDATGLVAYRVAVLATVAGVFSFWGSAGQFLVAAIGGILVGLGVGWSVAWIHRRLDDATIETVITLMTPYAAYLPAEALGLSGVLATVTTGIYVSRRSPILFAPDLRLHATAVWDVLIFVLNGLTFVLIGLQLPALWEGVGTESPAVVAGLALVTCLIVVVVRLAWIYPSALLPRWLSRRLRERDPLPPWGQLTVIGWAGMRGVVSLAAALALPLSTQDGSPFPKRELIIFTTFCVILFTLVVQSLTLPTLIRRLGVARGGKRSEVEEAEARLEVLEAAFTFLDQSAEDPDRPGLQGLRQQFERQRDHLQIRLGPARTAVIRVATVCKRLYSGALTAQRHRLIELWKKGRLHDELLHRIQREIDLEEARLRLYPEPNLHGPEVRVPLPPPPSSDLTGADRA